MLRKEVVEFIKKFLETEYENSNSLKELVVNFGFETFENENEFYELKREFKDMMISQNVTLNINGTNNKILKCDAYDFLIKTYPELTEIMCSHFDDEYMDSILVEEGISITFSTWESGAPASFTYNFDGIKVNYYNAELNGYDNEEDEMEMEEEVMANETIINVTVNDAIENMEENTMANETINNATVNNNNMEEETMRNENINETAATTEEVTMGEKAKEFAEASKEKLVDGFKFVVENISGAAEEVKKIADMSPENVEIYIKKNGKNVLDNIIDFINKYTDDLIKIEKRRPNNSTIKAKLEKSYNIVKLIKDVIDDKEKNGWGKFKSIVKELVGWIVRIFFKVGAIVLKLAFTVVAGAIKIGAVALVTTGKAVSILHKEIVKPGIDAGKKAKKAWDDKKAKEEFYDEDDFEEEDFQEVREALDLD